MSLTERNSRAVRSLPGTAPGRRGGWTDILGGAAAGHPGYDVADVQCLTADEDGVQVLGRVVAGDADGAAIRPRLV